MAWTAPRTFVTAETITASILNTHVRDNLLETGAAVIAGAAHILVGDGANSLTSRLINRDTVSTSQTTTSTSFTDLTTSGPAVTATTSANALVTVSANMRNSSAGEECIMGWAVTGATTVSASSSRSLIHESGAADARISASFTYLQTGLTAGSNTFTAKYQVTAGTGTFANRDINIVPL